MPVITPNLGLYQPLVNNATDADLWGGYLNDDMDILDTQIPARIALAIPPGIILPYGGLSEPSGYLYCYGQAISRVTYSTLFAIFSTTFGVGDGTTTFNLPDLRGRSVFGRDDMGGSTAGRITNAIAGIVGTNLGAAGGDQSLQAHNHGPAVGTAFVVLEAPGISQQPGGGTGVGSETVTGLAGAGASQNIPPAFILNYIVKT